LNTFGDRGTVQLESGRPLERFNNDSGFNQFNRTPAAPGTGIDTTNPRQQINTAIAREHNRIASMAPQWLSEKQRFQIARHVVAAEEQYIPYTEFLPAMGVTLPDYVAYDPTVNAGLASEFATVGYRAQSQRFQALRDGDRFFYPDAFHARTSS